MNKYIVILLIGIVLISGCTIKVTNLNYNNTQMYCEEKFNSLVEEWDTTKTFDLHNIILEKFPECVCLGSDNEIEVYMGTCYGLTDRTESNKLIEDEKKIEFCNIYQDDDNCKCLEHGEELGWDIRTTSKEITCYNKDGTTCILNNNGCNKDKVDLTKDCPMKEFIYPFIKGVCVKAVPKEEFK